MRNRKTFSKNTLVLIILFVIILASGGFFLGYRPYTRIKAKGNEVMVAAKKVSASFKTNSLALMIFPFASNKNAGTPMRRNSFLFIELIICGF